MHKCVCVCLCTCVCVCVCVGFLETTAKNALRTLHSIPFLSEKLAHILNIHMRRYIEYTYAYIYSCTLIYTYILSITHTHWRVTAYPVSTSLCVAEFTGKYLYPKIRRILKSPETLHAQTCRPRVRRGHVTNIVRTRRDGIEAFPRKGTAPLL